MSPPPPLSEALKNAKNQEKVITTYKDYVDSVIKKQVVTDEEKEIIADFFQTLSNRAIESIKNEASSKVVALEEMKNLTIKPDELVIHPQQFDGERPKPRKWIDDFKDAIKANTWSDEIAVKYFSTYLTKSAYSWYKTEVRPTIQPSTKFAHIAKMFADNYLGASDYSSICRQLERLVQKPNESVSVFIPKMRELLLLLEPELPEREQMRQIRAKLRPEYLAWIAHDEPRTMAELRSCCLKVEAGQSSNEKPRLQQNSKNDKARLGPKTERKPPYKKTEDNKKNFAMSKSIKCYECGRYGHIGKECRSRTAKKLQTKSANKTNSILEPKTGCNDEQDVLTVEHIHTIRVGDANEKLMANEHFDAADCPKLNSKSSVNLLAASEGKFICQKLKVNDTLVSALIDTGAYYSAVSRKISSENDWKVERPAPKLISAGGQPLECDGTTRLDVEITIGKRTKKIVHYAIVVHNLSTTMLVGLQLLGKLKININCELKCLFFEQPQRKGGVTLMEDIKIPARTMQTIKANANTTGTIIIKPGEHSPALVANSIDTVEDNCVSLILANTSNKKLSLNKGQKIASYEHLRVPTNATKRNLTEENIALLLEVGSSNETVIVGDELNEEQINNLRELLLKHRNAFSTNGKLGSTSIVKHKIELLPNATPYAEPIRRRAHAQAEEANKQIAEMLEANVIEPAKDSPWASAYVLVRKKNGEHRLCVDFRRLNAQTKKAAYPLPHIEDCIETIAAKQFFSLLDFNSGFWQIEVEEESRELTAFRCEQGHFQFKKMPFGLVNAPASFQRMVNALFAGLKGLNLQAFIDDVCLASHTWQEHIDLLDRVLEIIEHNNLTLKSSKCVLGARKVTFLGHEISHEGIRQDQNKLKAILKLPEPVNAQQVKQTLGLCSYYRKFVPGFALIAAPLIELTRKNVAFEWTEERKDAFRKLIQELGKNATLTTFRHTAPTIVKTDASRKGIAGILLQKHNDLDDWRIVACCSRRLSASEQNYAITDLEGLAVVYTLQKFRNYLLGKKFDLLTDHCALCILNQKQPKSPRLLRWALILSEFDMQVKYIKGALHADIDCLSRAPVIEDDDQFVEKLFHLAVPIDPQEWLASYNDEEAKAILEQAIKKEDGFDLRENVVYKDQRLYVPTDKRSPILDDCHNSPFSGHGGTSQTKERLKQFWWPSLDADVEKKVQTCETCQKDKFSTQKTPGTMRSFKVDEPAQLVAFDCLGPLYTTIRGNKHIILAIDAFTRFVDAKAVSDVGSATIAEFMIEHFSRFGIPVEVLFDNAPGFRANLIASINRTYGVKQRWATPLHSQSNAIAERALQSFQQKIRTTLHEEAMNDADWDLALPAATLAQNTSHNKSINSSPFELTFGRTHRFISDEVKTVPSSTHEAYLETIKRRLEPLYNSAQKTQTAAQSQNKKAYDARHRPLDIECGSLVLIKNKSRPAKLDHRYLGPYKIKSKNEDIYTLEKVADEPKSKTITRHISDLKMFSPAPSTLTLLMLICIAVTTGHELDNAADPLVWTQSDKIVTTGKTSFEFKYFLRNPCGRLTQVPTFKFSPDPLWTLDRESRSKCDRLYNEILSSLATEITQSYREPIFEPSIHSIEKRAVLEFVLGVFATDLVGSVYKWFNRDPDDSEIIKQICLRENITRSMQMAQQKAISSMQNQIIELAERTPEISLFTSFAVNEFKSVAEKIRRIALALKHRIAEVATIRELNEDGWPYNVDLSNTIPTGVNASFTDWEFKLSLQFTADRIDPNTLVYRLHGLSHWRNLSGTPELYQYAGPTYAIYNHKTKCAKAIEPEFERKIKTSCNQFNYTDPALKQWRLAFTSKNPYKTTQQTKFIESFPYTIVYCFTKKIRIANDTFNCPPHPFKIRADVSWATDDETFTPTSDSLTVNATIKASEISSPPVRTPSGIEDGLEAIRMLFELSERYEKLEGEQIALSIPIAEANITYEIIAKYLFWGCMCTLSTIGAAIWWNEQRHNHHREKVHHSHKTLAEKLTAIEEVMNLNQNTNKPEENNDSAMGEEPVATPVTQEKHYPNIIQIIKEGRINLD